MQADWGPLRHVRVIKERSTGVSRGFAFVDFPDVVRDCFFPREPFNVPLRMLLLLVLKVLEVTDCF